MSVMNIENGHAFEDPGVHIVKRAISGKLLLNTQGAPFGRIFSSVMHGNGASNTTGQCNIHRPLK